MAMQQVDKYNSIKSEEWARAQERRAHGKAERHFGISEAVRLVEDQRRRHKSRYQQTHEAYHWAAIAVLDDMLERLQLLERQALDAYNYEVWVWTQEMERVKTQVLPVQGKR